MAYFQSHVQYGMHNAVVVNYFWFGNKFDSLSVSQWTCNKWDKFNRRKIKLHFYENYFTDDPITCMSSSKHFQKVQMPFYRYECHAMAAAAAEAAAAVLVVCVNTRIIENNVNSSPAMLAKWYSHTK